MNVASAKGRQCSALAAVDWDDQQRQHDTPDEEALLERDATVVLSLSEPKSAPVPELVASNVLSLKKPCIPTWVARVKSRNRGWIVASSGGIFCRRGLTWISRDSMQTFATRTHRLRWQRRQENLHNKFWTQLTIGFAGKVPGILDN